MWRSAPGAAAHESLRGSPLLTKPAVNQALGVRLFSPPQGSWFQISPRERPGLTHQFRSDRAQPHRRHVHPSPTPDTVTRSGLPPGPPTDSPYARALPCVQFIRRSSSEFKKPVSSLGYFLLVKRCNSGTARRKAEGRVRGRGARGSALSGGRTLLNPRLFSNPETPQLSSSGLLWRLHYMRTTH